MGTVTDANTGMPLSNVTVINTKTHNGVSTDEHGVFVIPASQGNVISFSYIGYKTVQKAKPPSVGIATITIAMEPAEFMLEEFRLRPGRLTQYQLDSTERAAIYKVPLQRMHPNAFASPAGAFAELFSQKAKRIYAFQKNFIAGEIEKFVDTRYKPELVTRLTGLTGDSIGHFMYEFPMAYDYARAATDLEIKMWIRSNYRIWIKTLVPDTAASSIHKMEEQLKK